MKSASRVCMCRYTFCMKVVVWLLGAAAIGVLVYGLVKWRRRSEELRRASEERSAALMAEVMATTKSRPAPPQAETDLARAADFAKAAELARATDVAKTADVAKAADFAKAADLAKQRLLFEAAAKAGEAGEPVLSIQLYARLLARYPDSAFAAQARAAVEAQKKNLTKA
jgi:hypothetical protein